MFGDGPSRSGLIFGDIILLKERSVLAKATTVSTGLIPSITNGMAYLFLRPCFFLIYFEIRGCVQFFSPYSFKICSAKSPHSDDSLSWSTLMARDDVHTVARTSTAIFL